MSDGEGRRRAGGTEAVSGDFASQKGKYTQRRQAVTAPALLNISLSGLQS